MLLGNYEINVFHPTTLTKESGLWGYQLERETPEESGIYSVDAKARNQFLRDWAQEVKRH